MNRLLFYLVFATCFLTLFSCRKEYSFEQGNIVPSEGSLWDSSGACLPSTVHGTFYGGVTPGSDTAYVEIQVNVTQTGSYNIATDLQDGFSFADSGFFSNTGVNTVRLKPVGIPIINTTSTFTVSFDSTACSFTVVIQDSTGTGLGGNDTTGTGGDTSQVQTSIWQFNQGSLTFSGTFDTTSKDNSSGVATVVLMAGTNSTGDTAMELTFAISGTDIKPGTYTTANNGMLFSVVEIPTLTTLYTASLSTTGTDLTVVVISYDATKKEMKGTFSGNAQTDAGTIVPITNGSLDVFFP